MLIDNLIELNTIEKLELDAVPANVLHQYFVGKAGTKETGTMPDNGAVSKVLSAGESYTVPLGYHNGSGVITAKSLAEQTTATAGAAQILAPYTAWVTGGKITGTMVNRTGWSSSTTMNGSIGIPQGYHDGSGKVNGPVVTNRGAWTGSVSMNSSVTIPEGYHNGSGKVNGPVITNRGAWTSRISANGKVMIPEGYHNGDGYVDQSLTGKSAATYTPSISNQTIAANQWLTGAQTILGDPNLKAENIKEGITIFNIKGKLVGGIVLGDADIYYKGIAKYGIVAEGQMSIDESQITANLPGANYTGSFSTTASISLSGYSKLCFEHELKAPGAGKACTVFVGSTRIYALEGGLGLPSSIDITQHQIAGILKVNFSTFYPNIGDPASITGPIFRIWLE